MSRLRTILTISVAANIGLLVALRSSRPAVETSSVSAPHAAVADPESRRDANNAEEIAAGTQVASASPAASKSPPQGPSWTELNDGGVERLAERLRAGGFPPHIIRAIISSTVQEQFRERREELLAGDADAPYWKETRGSLRDPDKAAAYQKLGRDQSELLQNLLGQESGGDGLARVYQERKYGPLSDEKMSQLQNLIADYGDLRLQARATGPQTAEDLQRVSMIEKEFKTDLASLLTPEELEQYDLRSSPTALRLRNRLDSFAATEEEYRAIYRLQQSIDEKLPASQSANPQLLAARRAAEEQMQSQLRATLGPERYADYEHATNPAYNSLNRLATRLELPLSASREVVAVQQSIQSRAQAVLTSDTLTRAEQQQQLRILADEATRKIGGALTPRGLQAYQQSGGQWLQQLVKSADAPATP